MVKSMELSNCKKVKKGNTYHSKNHIVRMEKLVRKLQEDHGDEFVNYIGFTNKNPEEAIDISRYNRITFPKHHRWRDLDGRSWYYIGCAGDNNKL